MLFISSCFYFFVIFGNMKQHLLLVNYETIKFCSKSNNISYVKKPHTKPAKKFETCNKAANCQAFWPAFYSGLKVTHDCSID